MSGEEWLVRDGRPVRGAGLKRAGLTISVCFFAICLIYPVRSGMLTRGVSRWLDAQWLYVGGSCWLRGDSPYNTPSFYECWREKLPNAPRSPFVYPPPVALVAVPVSSFCWSTAKWICDAVNVLALILCLVLLAGIASRAGAKPGNAFLWLGLGAACLVSSVPAVIFLGQTSLLALAGTVGAIYAGRQRRGLLCSAFVLVACMKPQIAVLPLLYMAIAGAHREVLLGLGFAAVVSICVFAIGGTGLPFGDIMHCLDGYAAYPPNCAPHVTGLSSLFLGTPLEFSAVVWLGLGALLVATIGFTARFRRAYYEKRSTTSLDQRYQEHCLAVQPTQLAFAATGAFVQLHPYDYVIYVPIVASLFMAGCYRRILWLAPGLLVVTRPGNIHDILTTFAGAGLPLTRAQLATVGAVYVLLLMLYYWISVSPAKRFARTTVQD